MTDGFRGRPDGVGVIILTNQTILRFALIALTGSALAACASHSPSQQAKEYFPQSKYGKASPRVASLASPKRRGGGRYQVGEPYQVAGVWYYPKVDPNYSRVGRASWYGAAFDGRLTANGEVYDMHALTAASPTLPLPSYARVTNLRNGSSVVVRVNDRGPFAKGRIIDLSARAAKMLAYKDNGVAKVKVDYVGPAPLHGDDQPYLMASYKPPRGEGIGQPASGVMLAMNGSTPTESGYKPLPSTYQLASLAPVPQSNPAELSRGSASAALERVADTPVRMIGPGDPTLPAVGPIVLDRPEGARLAANPAEIDLAPVGSISRVVSSYADQRVATASAAEGAMNNVLSPAAIASEWRAFHGTAPSSEPATDYVNVGLFSDSAQAHRIAAVLKGYGEIRRAHIPTASGSLDALSVIPAKGINTDTILEAAWNAGAKDAFTVRADGS